MDAVIAALDGYAAEMAALRQEGLTRGLPAHAAEHVFALGFALDQMRQHLRRSRALRDGALHTGPTQRPLVMGKMPAACCRAGRSE